MSASKPQIGALHFASPQTFHQSVGDRSAWLAAGDAEPTRLVEALADLPPHGVWWTNLEFSDLQRAHLLGRPDLKPAGYLPTRPRSVVAELGLIGATPDRQAAACGQVFERVMTRSRDLFGLSVTPPGNSLPDALREHFFNDDPAPFGEIESRVQYALDAAAQAVTQSGYTEHYDDSQLVVLRHHRQQYAADMLAAPTPFGEWRMVSVPDEPKGQLQWVREQDGVLPLLMRVTVRFTGSNRHERMMLAGFGSGSRRVHVEGGPPEAGARQWIATPEYLALAPYAEIEIHEAFAAEGFQPNRWMMLDRITDGPPDKASIQIGPLMLLGRGALAYADGLIAEAMWHGATRSRGQHRSAQATWLISLDRARCIETAFAISEQQFEGVQVAGFSRGRIWLRMNANLLRTPEDQAQLVAEVVLLSGLVPPALPEVQHYSHARLRIAHALRERARDLGEAGAACFASAMNILGNRAILLEAI